MKTYTYDKKKNKTIGKKSVSDLGRLGGRATVKRYGKNYMRELGKRGARARWGLEDPRSDGV